MDSFSSYNQIDILPTDKHKITLIFSWGTFSYWKLPFVLKNAGATFQWAMSYAFHDIKHIVEHYLDDLVVHLSNKKYDIGHIREIFLICMDYNIHLNPKNAFFLLN